MFHYSSYWHTWSRVLGTNVCKNGEGAGYIVEVNITPIHKQHFSDQPRSGWKGEVKPVVIRAHFTAPHRGDKSVAELPQEVINELYKQVGRETADFILNGDILPLIDWKKFNAHSNGGCDLADCRKEDAET